MKFRLLQKAHLGLEGQHRYTDMETLQEMICSKSYGSYSQKLAKEIAIPAKCLAMGTISHTYISFLLACRLAHSEKRQ